MGFVTYYDEGKFCKLYIDDDINDDYESLFIGDFDWIYWYMLAENYFNHYGNLLIPSGFKTKDGYTYDSDGYNLGHWIIKQRYVYKYNEDKEKLKSKKLSKLTSYQIELLKNINMVFDVNEYKWEFMFNLASKFYEHNKHLNVPDNFKTKDGYTYDSDGYYLDNWIESQRQAYKNIYREKEDRTSSRLLTQEKLNRLESIGFTYGDIKDVWWNKSYNKLKNYYEHFGTTVVSNGFRTKDGYTYDSDGSDLHCWMSLQRMAYKKQFINPNLTKRVKPLSEEQIKKLEDISMIFDYDLNMEKNIILFKNYNIPIENNMFLISKKSNLELKTKIKFLQCRNLPIRYGNFVHEIFYMKDLEMKAKYGYTLAELIEFINNKNKVYVKK